MTFGYCQDYHLSVVTPPAIEPITLDQALVQCHANQGVEDDWFTDTITTVRQDAENFTRRAFIEQTLRITFDYWPGFPILVPRPPLIEIESFTLYDLEDNDTSIAISDLLVDTYSSPGRVCIDSGYSLPSVSLREINSVIIQYKAGYGSSAADVPKTFKKAMLLQLGYMYECRSGEATPITEQYKNLLNRQRMYL